MNTPSTAVSPGIGGFVAFFVLAIALWLLMRNMNARMRRMSYRAEEEQRRAGAEARGVPTGEADGPHAGPQHADAPEGEGGAESGDREDGDAGRGPAGPGGGAPSPSA